MNMQLSLYPLSLRLPFLPIAWISLLLVSPAALFAQTAPATPARDPELQRVYDQFHARLTRMNPPKPPEPGATEPPPKPNWEIWLEMQNADGSWSDIDYTSKSGKGWEPEVHSSRMLNLARLYSSPSSQNYADARLLVGIQRALAFWFEKDFVSANWFHNEIRIPQHMGQLLFMMGDKLTPEERNKAMGILSRSRYGKYTGQNRVWVAGNILMAAVLKNKLSTAQEAATAISDELTISPKNVTEGLRADYTYHQHGPQLNTGTYGLSFAGDSLQWIEVLRGTSMAFPLEKSEIIRNYLLQGLGPILWQGRMDISSCGRQLFPGQREHKAKAVIKLLNEMAVADPEYAPRYLKLAADAEGKLPPEEREAVARYYWRSDYLVDRRKTYLASVRMNSARTRGSECINQENLPGGFLADGALFVYRTGGEYDDLMPVWAWKQIPGITAVQSGGSTPTAVQRVRNAATFVGGVSDGTEGVAAMDYQFNDYVAQVRPLILMKKSWFFFEGQIVCLGAGITSEAKNKDMATTLNQCLLNGPVLASTGAEATLVESRQTIPNLKWAWHDRMGYYFPEPVEATVGGETRTGNWGVFYTKGPKEPVTKDVFLCAINHPAPKKDAGQPKEPTFVKDAKYAYVLLPDISEKAMGEYAATPGASVLSNTPDLQAARAGNSVGVVFYAPGELEYAPGKKLKVEQPCVALIQDVDAQPRLWVAEPTQLLPEIRLSLNGKETTVKLPEGNFTGSSVEVTAESAALVK